MSTRKSHVFYGLLIALTSIVAGMVLASRLDLAPASFAGAMDVPVVNTEPIEGPLDATTFRRIAEAASPSVVSIVVTSRRQAGQSTMDLFGFEIPFGGRDPSPQLEQGAGSGFIIDANGFILTNNHVVADAERMDVWLLGMDSQLDPGLPAELVGRDELTDSALIKLTDLPDRPLVAAKFGDSDQMLPGDWVMAIGNPFGLSHTVTVGVVSASAREQALAVAQRYEDLIQTDAAINRGNSGGPLLNIRGEVVGINTMIVSNGQNGGNLGIGFAMPINTITEILPELRSGKVTRGRIGVSVSRYPITDEYARELGLPRAAGAEVVDVNAGGPSDEAGIQVGDIITQFNDQDVSDNEALVDMVVRTKPGMTVPVVIYRDGERQTLSVTVEELDLETERGEASGRETPGRRPSPTLEGFGITIEPLTREIAEQLGVPQGRGGAVVVGVEPFSPADGTLGRGDVILRVGNQEVGTVDEVSDALDAVPAGSTARLFVWRGGREQLVRVRKR